LEEKDEFGLPVKERVDAIEKKEVEYLRNLCK